MKLKPLAILALCLTLNISYCSFSDDFSSDSYYSPSSKGLEYYNSQNYSKAIIEFEKALKTSPKDVDARNNIAASYIARGNYFLNNAKDFDRAANDYRKAIFYLKHDENISSDQSIKDNVKVAEKNLEKIMKYLNLSFEPKDRLVMAKQLRGRGYFQQAVVEYNAALADESLQPEVLETLGDMMRVLKKHYKSANYYDKALMLNSEEPKLHLKFARALHSLGAYEYAVNEYNIALSKSEENADSKDEIILELEKIWTARLKKTPNDVSAHLNLGVVLQKKGQYQDAMAQYKAAQLIQPGNNEVKLNIATLYQEQGNIPAAIEIYDSILLANPKDYKAHYYRATALNEVDKIEEALKELNIALNLKPDYQEAKEAYLDVVKKIPNKKAKLNAMHQFSSTHPNDAYIQFAFAYELHKEDLKDDALFYYQKTIKLNPNNIDAYLNIANIQNEKQQYDLAIKTLEDALCVDAGNKKVTKLLESIKMNTEQVNFELAAEKFNKGDYQGAIDQYLLIKTPNSDVFAGLGLAYQSLKQFDEAINYYNKAIELNNENSNAYYYLGTAYYAKNNYLKAEENYNKAISIDENNTEAKAALDTLIKSRNQDLLEKALNYYNNSNYKHAIVTLDKILKYDEKNAYAYYYRALSYDALSKTWLAISDYRKAAKYSPDLYIAYYSIAINYDSLKNNIEAKKAFLKFISIAEEKNDDSNKDYLEYSKQRVKEL